MYVPSYPPGSVRLQVKVIVSAAVSPVRTVGMCAGWVLVVVVVTNSHSLYLITEAVII